jgi:hypothetical protein
MQGLIDDGMLAALAAVGSPEQVASDIAGRFGGHVDREGFYTPYLICEGTFGELAAEMASAAR